MKTLVTNLQVCVEKGQWHSSDPCAPTVAFWAQALIGGLFAHVPCFACFADKNTHSQTTILARHRKRERDAPHSRGCDIFFIGRYLATFGH